jgi:PilZ domain
LFSIEIESMSPAETTYFCLETGDGSLSHPWSLVERSEGGARLLVDDPARVPDKFTLVQKGQVTTLWKCRVVWRSDSHVGVKFEGHHATSA